MAYLLKFHPVEDLVCVALRQRQVVLTTRIDLPPPGLATAVLAHLRTAFHQAEADAVALIAYTDTTGDATIKELMAVADLPVFEALRVHEGRWWSHACRTPGCCVPGTPFVADLNVQASFVATGHAVQPDRAALAACLTPHPASVLEQVRYHLARSFLDAATSPSTRTHQAPNLLSAV